MAHVRSVLAPIDLTPASDRVLARVALLPLADDARVTLLHVVPDSLPGGARREAERDAEKALAGEARQLRGSLPRKVSLESLVVSGVAVKTIGAHASASKAELIVMGRGGGRVLRDAFLGSTAERVVRQARVPVLVVRRPARSAYARPALALDLDRAAAEIVRLLLLVVPSPRERVEVIHAHEIPYAGMLYSTVTQEHFERTKDQFQRDAAGELARRLAAVLARLGVAAEDAPTWRFHVRHGSPRGVILQAIRRSEPDLLVLGTRGYTGVAHALLGTVAGDVLRAAGCDVLVVPPVKGPAGG